MNDKQQLAAMGEHIAEQQQPMCLQRRVEHLEALLREARPYVKDCADWGGRHSVDLRDDIDEALNGVTSTRQAAPKGWQLVPAEVVTPELSWPLGIGVTAFEKADGVGCELIDCIHDAVQAMLAAAPSPDSDK